MDPLTFMGIILFLAFFFRFILPLTKPRTQRVRLVPKHSRTIPQNVKIAVAVRDGGRCRACGATLSQSAMHFDHIIPYSRGGSSTDPANVQLLCARCNLRKGAR
jgi:5-methylcytosine-specific restriction endonuclease McrA